MLTKVKQIFRELLLLLTMALVPCCLAVWAGTTNLSDLSLSGDLSVGDDVTISGDASVAGNLTVTGTQTQTGVITASGANVITHANTGLKVLDTGGDHAISIVPTSDEAAARQVSIPALGGTKVLGFIDLAQTISAVQTLTAQPILPAGVTSSKGVRFDGATNDAVVVAADHAAERIYTIPDCGAAASFVMSELAQTINGVKTFGSIPVLPSCSLKRQTQRVQLSPVTGAAADSTTYAGLCSFGRAGTVKKISFVCTVAPTVGTDTIEVLKNNTTTMLNAATYDANSLTALTVADATLTATGADLALVATDVIRCKYNAGSQTVDAQDVTAIIEFEPTDF